MSVDLGDRAAGRGSSLSPGQSAMVDTFIRGPRLGTGVASRAILGPDLPGAPRAAFLVTPGAGL